MNWPTQDSQFCEYWESSRPKILNAIQQGNPTRLLDLITKGLQQILADCMQPPEKDKPITKPAPLLLFCKRRRKHPDYPELISAIQRADTQRASREMDRMSRDSRRDYMASAHPSNTSAFFRYLAKEDGRRSRQTL